MGSAGPVGWRDLTRPVLPGMDAYPGDPPVGFERLASVEAGDGYSLHRVTMGNHAGTHVDAPAHVVPCGTTVDGIPLDLLCGEALLVDLPAGGAERGVLAGRIADGIERVLLRPDGAAAYLSAEGARWLTDAGVRLVGWSGLSVDPVGAHDLPAHRALLSRGVVIVEGLVLDDLEAGPYDLVVLPLRLQGLDGAPARAMARRRAVPPAEA